MLPLLGSLLLPVLLAAGDSQGPRLTDAELFQAMDLGADQWAEVRRFVQAEEWASAKRAYAARFRARTSPKWPGAVHERPKPPERRPATADADRLLSHQWKWQREWFDLGPDIDWSSNQMTEGESATVEWNASLNRHFHFRTLCRAYLRTGEEKYAAEVVAQMIDWIEDCPVLLDRSGNSPYHYGWETLNAACRAGDTWPGALHSILPSRSLTDEALCTIVKSLVEHARHLDRWPTRSGNWLTAESKALFIVGTLLPEFREARQWRAHAIERLYRQLHTDVYPDGLEIELALGYNNWVLRNFAEVLELARLNDLTGELPDDYLKRMEAMYDYQAGACRPDGRVPGLNDSGDASPTGLLEAGHGYFPHRKDFLWIATAGERGEKPTKTSVAFPYAGHYVMRSGWDRHARYLLFDAGPFGSGHQHEDKLHLVLYAYGRPLLLDAGNYMYDRSRWRRYVLSTRGHNTIRIDGHDQNRRRDRATWVLGQPFQPLDNPWVADEAFDYCVGRYESGYGPQRSIDVTHTRAVVFVKPDYWILVDTLHAGDDAEHGFESLFHLGADEARVDPQSGAIATCNEDAANLVVWPVSAGDLAARVVKGVEQEPVQGWAQGPWRPVPTAIATGKFVRKAKIVTLLYPLKPNAENPVRSVKLAPVRSGGKVAEDAVAVAIDLADGARHCLLVAERPGVDREWEGGSTRAALAGLIRSGDTTRPFELPAEGK